MLCSIATAANGPSGISAAESERRAAGSGILDDGTGFRRTLRVPIVEALQRVDRSYRQAAVGNASGKLGRGRTIGNFTALYVVAYLNAVHAGVACQGEKPAEIAKGRNGSVERKLEFHGDLPHSTFRHAFASAER